MGHHHTTTPYRSFVSETTPLTSTCLFSSGQPPIFLEQCVPLLDLSSLFVNPSNFCLPPPPLPLWTEFCYHSPPPLPTHTQDDIWTNSSVLFRFFCSTFFSCLVFFFISLLCSKFCSRILPPHPFPFFWCTTWSFAISHSCKSLVFHYLISIIFMYCKNYI